MTASSWIHGGSRSALVRGAGAGLVLLASLLLGGCAMETGTDDGQTVSQDLTSEQAPSTDINNPAGVQTATGDGTNFQNPGAPRMEQAGGPGDGPDPVPWREQVAAQPGPGDGPDPVPWRHPESYLTVAK